MDVNITKAYEDQRKEAVARTKAASAATTSNGYTDAIKRMAQTINDRAMKDAKNPAVVAPSPANSANAKAANAAYVAPQYAPENLAPIPEAYTAKTFTAEDPQLSQFNLARSRAKADVSSAEQTQKDALKRRFAAMGSPGSGAELKLTQNIDQKGDENLAKANEGIDAAQNTEIGRLNEAEKNKEFSSRENRAGLEFARGERIGGQTFQAQQRSLQNDYADFERKATQGFTADQTQKAQEIQKSQFASQLDIEKQKFDEEKFVDRANIEIAKATLNQQDLLEKILNPGGGDFYSAKNIPGAQYIPGLGGGDNGGGRSPLPYIG